MCIHTGLYTPFWYIELFMLSRGSSMNLAFYTIAIMNAAGVIGRIGSGYIADRVRPVLFSVYEMN